MANNCYPCEYSILQDLQYKDNDNSVTRNTDILAKNRLDLFVPKNSPIANGAVVVFVHGGGWMRGDRRAYRHYFSTYDTNLLVALALAYYDAYWNVGKAFARSGVACAVVSYRLSRLEFPWLMVELLFSLFMSVFVILTPLLCLVLLGWCISVIFTGNDIGYHSGMTDCSYTPYMSVFTIFALLIVLSFLIVWMIVCQSGEGYFITPFQKIWPLMISLFITCMCLNVGITSITVCLMVFLGISLLHSFATFQQKWRPSIKHPSHVSDVALSIKWIKNFAATSKMFDSNRIFLCGHSAGGHLVSLLALDSGYLEGVGLSLSDIQGVISISGVYNLHNLSGGLLEYLFLRPAFGSNKDLWTSASPLFHLVQQKQSSIKVTNQATIPFLVMNAERDPMLNQDAQQFVAMLTEQSYPCQHWVIPNVNHLSIILSFGRSTGQTYSAEQHCLAFIKSIVSGKL